VKEVVDPLTAIVERLIEVSRSSARYLSESRREKAKTHFGLSDFVVVMRECQIHSPRVYIHAVS